MRKFVKISLSFNGNANLHQKEILCPHFSSRFIHKTCVDMSAGWRSSWKFVNAFHSSTKKNVSDFSCKFSSKMSVFCFQLPIDYVTNRNWSVSYTTKVEKNKYFFSVKRWKFYALFHVFIAIIDSLRADVDCGCLKDCDEIKFLLQSTETMFWFHKSRVSWTLSQSKVIYKRELIHGIIEALILTGGSLSLFIGMSCLSLIEIGFFIYLFLRNK